MKRTAILGIGSPFGDDRAGWLVIEALEAMLGAHERAAAGVTLTALDRPGVGLLEQLRNVDRAVLIDAVCTDAEPGTLMRLDADRLQTASRLSSHGVGVAETLALGATLRMLPPELVLLGIATGLHAEATSVSAIVRASALRLARVLQRWLQEGGAGTPLSAALERVPE